MNFRVMTLLVLLYGCAAPSGQSTETNPDTPQAPPEAPKTSQSEKSRPQDFTAAITVNGEINPAFQVGASIQCIGETSVPSGEGVSYKTKWTARWKRFGFADWVTRDVTEELAKASGTVTTGLAHLEISCTITATSDSMEVTVSSPSPFLKVINTEPAPFVVSIVGGRSSGLEDSGLTNTEYPKFMLAGDVISCGGSTTDSDGDLLTYGTIWLYKTPSSVEWETINTGATHTALKDKAGSLFKCAVSAYDSSGGVYTAESDTLIVGNRAPDIFSSQAKKATAGLFFNLPAGSTISIEDVLSCSGQSTDPDQSSPPSIQYEWRIYSDASATSYTVLSNDKDYIVSASAAHKHLACIAVATDSLGKSRESLASRYQVINSAPQPFSARIDGELRIGKTAKCVGTPIDLDQDELGFSFQWYARKGGEAQQLDGQFTNELVIMPSLAKSELRCAMTASDGFGGTTASTPSAWLEVLNSRPEISKASISINSAEPRVLTEWTCEATASDIDGDMISKNYLWEKSDTDGGGFVPITRNDTGEDTITILKHQPTSLQTITISTKLAHKYIRCSVAASDGIGFSVSGDPSDIIRVINSRPAPEGFIVSTLPSPTATLESERFLKVGGNFICDGITSDLDADIITYSRIRTAQRLSREGTVIGDKIDIRSLLGLSAPSIFDNKLSISPELAHTAIDCTITADDGHEDGITHTETSQQVFVANTAPAPFTGSLPEASKAGELLECNASTTDADLDTITMSSLWIVKNQYNTPIPSTDTNPMDNNKFTVEPQSVGNRISCVRTANDGWGGITTFTYNESVVVNSLPLEFTAILTSSQADKSNTKVGDIISCSGATIDQDDYIGAPRLLYKSRFVRLGAANEILGHAVDSDWGEYSGDASLGNHVAQHIVTENDAHQKLACQIMAKDADGGETISRVSEPIQIANTPPNAFTSTLTAPSEVFVGSNLACAPSSIITDSDGDSVTVSYEWEKGSPQPDGSVIYTKTFGYSAETITLSSVYAHGQARCIAVADDGFGGITKSTPSDDVDILNSPPEKLPSKVARISNPEPALPDIGAAQFGYDSTVSCVETGPRFDKDLDAVEIDYYIWGVRNDAGIFIPEPDMGSQKNFTITDATRKKIAHKTIACKIVVKDIPPEFASWSPILRTESDFGTPASYLNAPPSDYATAFSLVSSPVYSDTLQQKDIDMAGRLVVGSYVNCSSSPTDPDNGGLPEADFVDRLTTTYTLQKKVVIAGSANSTVFWQPASNDSGEIETTPPLRIYKTASHSIIRCHGLTEDGKGGVTASTQMAEDEVLNTPPVVMSSPSADSPAIIPENSAISLPATIQGTEYRFEAIDVDGDALSWSPPGTPEDASWAYKSSVTAATQPNKIYEIKTTANPVAGSDGYDYASLTTPETSDAAAFVASVSDGYTSSSGKVYFKVSNVDRQPTDVRIAYLPYDDSTGRVLNLNIDSAESILEIGTIETGLETLTTDQKRRIYKICLSSTLSSQDAIYNAIRSTSSILLISGGGAVSYSTTNNISMDVWPASASCQIPLYIYRHATPPTTGAVLASKSKLLEALSIRPAALDWVGPYQQARFQLKSTTASLTTVGPNIKSTLSVSGIQSPVIYEHDFNQSLGGCGNDGTPDILSRKAIAARILYNDLDGDSLDIPADLAPPVYSNPSGYINSASNQLAATRIADHIESDMQYPQFKITARCDAVRHEEDFAFQDTWRALIQKQVAYEGGGISGALTIEMSVYDTDRPPLATPYEKDFYADPSQTFPYQERDLISTNSYSAISLGYDPDGDILTSINDNGQHTIDEISRSFVDLGSARYCRKDYTNRYLYSGTYTLTANGVSSAPQPFKHYYDYQNGSSYPLAYVNIRTGVYSYAGRNLAYVPYDLFCESRANYIGGGHIAFSMWGGLWGGGYYVRLMDNGGDIVNGVDKYTMGDNYLYSSHDFGFSFNGATGLAHSMDANNFGFAHIVSWLNNTPYYTAERSYGWGDNALTLPGDSAIQFNGYGMSAAYPSYGSRYCYGGDGTSSPAVAIGEIAAGGKGYASPWPDASGYVFTCILLTPRR